MGGIIVAVIAVIILVLVGGAFAGSFISGMINKKKYEGQSMEPTKDWYETSQSMYFNRDETKKSWYFSYDKHVFNSGHVMVNETHQPVYEAKVLYGDPINGFEMDFYNHVIGYKHHHNIGVTTTSSDFRHDEGLPNYSAFKFDGVDIWDYLTSLGYDYHLIREGKLSLAYHIDMYKDGMPIGTVYSSNGGKNYFGHTGPIEPKAGSKGLYVIECAEKDIDALFLLAITFTRTELSYDNLNHNN